MFSELSSERDRLLLTTQDGQPPQAGAEIVFTCEYAKPTGLGRGLLSALAFSSTPVGGWHTRSDHRGCLTITLTATQGGSTLLLDGKQQFCTSFKMQAPDLEEGSGRRLLDLSGVQRQVMQQIRQVLPGWGINVMNGAQNTKDAGTWTITVRHA